MTEFEEKHSVLLLGEHNCVVCNCVVINGGYSTDKSTGLGIPCCIECYNDGGMSNWIEMKGHYHKSRDFGVKNRTLIPYINSNGQVYSKNYVIGLKQPLYAIIEVLRSQSKHSFASSMIEIQELLDYYIKNVKDISW